MKTVQLRKQENTDWEYLSEKIELKAPLVLVFGNRYMLENTNIYEQVRELFPDGQLASIDKTALRNYKNVF